MMKTQNINLAAQGGILHSANPGIKLGDNKYQAMLSKNNMNAMLNEVTNSQTTSPTNA